MHAELVPTYAGAVYLATVAIEPNRWRRQLQPVEQASHWIDRALQEGFSGIELWEDHYLKADVEEKSAIQQRREHIQVYNSYCSFEANEEAAASRLATLQAVRELGVKRVKYNIGGDPKARAVYLSNLEQWRAAMPDDVELLCECHPGTLIETPEAAVGFFQDAEWEDAPIVLHPFWRDDAQIEQWLTCFGARIRHLHVQLRDAENRIVPLKAHLETVVAKFAQTAPVRARCSWALEFTGGMGQGEAAAALFANLCSDLRQLRDLLTSSGDVSG